MNLQFLQRIGGSLLLGAAAIVGLTAEPVAAQCGCACGNGSCTTDYFGSDSLDVEYPAMEDTLSSTPAPAPSFDSFAFDGGSQGSVGNPGAVYGGYIDSAIPMNQVRFRMDASFDFLQPDRAEFFYGACACAGGPGPGSPDTTPVTVNSGIDAQDYSIYLESQHSDNFSWFVELPFRHIDYAPNNIGGVPTLDSGNDSGLGDINAGFKYVLASDCCRDELLTFQFRVYTPTGDASRGLGTNHVSLEPALLYQNRITDRWTLFGEVRDWIPIGGFQLNGEEFSSNVLRYGAGLGYTTHDCCNWTVTPMVEVVGWTIFTGLMTDTPVAVTGAEGTIVNVKAGVRISNRQGFGSRPTSLYVGYGRAVTGDTWYQDIVRAEYSIMF